MAKSVGKSANGSAPKSGKLMAGSTKPASVSMGGPPKTKTSERGGMICGSPKKGC